MNKNIVIAFLMGTILTLLVVNYLPKFDIKIEVTEKSEPVKEDKTEKNELSEQTSIVDRLKSKILPEPIPEITSDEFLLQNYPDTRISSDHTIKTKNIEKNKTMRKDIGAEFIRAQNYLSKDNDEALNILDNILKTRDLRVYEIAVLLRTKSYAFYEKKDYVQALKFHKESFSHNGFDTIGQLDLQFGIAQLYFDVDQWGNGFHELIDWFSNAISTGNPPGPSANALLSEIYLYFADKTEKDSLAEKQFFEKSKRYAKLALFEAAEPREAFHLLYLSNLLYEKNFYEAKIILEQMVERFPSKSEYKKLLSELYFKLDVDDGLFPKGISSESIDNFNFNNFGSENSRVFTVERVFGEKSSATTLNAKIPEQIKVEVIEDRKGSIKRCLTWSGGKCIKREANHEERLRVYNKSCDIAPLLKSSAIPHYPRRAMQRGIEGWTLVEFTITKEGDVINPIVIDADPPGIFNRSAMRKFSKYKYLPAKKNCKKIETKIQQLATWELEDKK